MLATVLHRTTGYTGELILGDGTVLEFVNGQAGPASITFVDAQSLTVMGYSVITADPPPAVNDQFDVKAASLVPAGHVLGDALRAALVPFWTAAETVTTGTVRVDSTGHLITANSNRTTRGTYDATEQAAWTVVSGGGGGAVTSVAGRAGVVVLTASDLSDSTATGRSLVTATDAPTARTALGLGTAATQPTSAFDPAGAAAGMALVFGA